MAESMITNSSIHNGTDAQAEARASTSPTVAIPYRGHREFIHDLSGFNFAASVVLD